MSTYLLAWVIGELHKQTATTKNNVEVNVWATPAQSAESLSFALDIATRTIDFYDEYFDTPYPLPKSDHVALPDFSSGAMENWGLVTYREVALLAEPKTTSISSKQYIATVIAHELAHQWFGNLVTMKWWDNLWLNESFATLMEYIAVDALHPEWNIWNEFSTNESILALRRDAMDGVQAVQVAVNHPDEISTLFDGAIVYAKGARLLRMLQHYVGDAAFQQGLATYFSQYAYGNTEGDDLWNAIGAASGKNITDMMNTWIQQPGYPVLSVDQQGTAVTLSQTQFFVGEHAPSTKTWPIPLNASCSEMPELFSEATATYERHHETTLRFNISDASHFITHYSPALFGRLLDDLKNGTLPELNRMQLINETTLLVRGGLATSAELIPLIQAFKNETSEPVWGMVSLALGELRKFVEHDPEAEQKLRALSGEIATQQYNRLGWDSVEGESEEDSKLRAVIIGLMLYSEQPEVLAEAARRFDTTALEQLDPELRSLIISNVVRYGDIQTVQPLLDTYVATQSAELSQDLCAGLTSTRTPEAISLLLASIKDSSIIRPQDTFRWFAYLMRNRDARAMTWQWLQDNWQWVETTFGGDKSYDDFPRYAAAGLITKEQLAEYNAFFAPKEAIPALTRVIVLGRTEIEARVALIERDEAAVVAALKAL
jgi:aminopeptidase N